MILKFPITFSPLMFLKVPNYRLNRITTFVEHYGAYAHDVMVAILVFQNNETAAMLVYQINPVEVQLFSYVNTFFCSNKFAWLLDA